MNVCNKLIMNTYTKTHSRNTMTRLHSMLASPQPIGSMAQIHFPVPSPQAKSLSCAKSQAPKKYRRILFEVGNRTEIVIVPETEEA